MRDIPMFATELGVASLMLKQIPYSGCAYIHIRSSALPREFLDECVRFCRSAGATRIFAAGNACLKDYPHCTDVILMEGPCPKTDFSANLVPVCDKTIHDWLTIYNEKMQDISISSHLSPQDIKELLKDSQAYFVYEQATLLGIGVVSGNKIHAIAGCRKGLGVRVFLALCNAISQDTVLVEVATNNLPAVRLYERMGLVKKEILSSWYEINLF